MDNFSIRLNELLREYLHTDPCPCIIFWYRCQLALSIAVRRQVLNLGDLLKQIVTYACRHEGYENSEELIAVIKSYINKRLTVNETRWNKRLDIRKYFELGFVKARHLGCARIGNSVYEVSMTVILLAEHPHPNFCYRLCGCADEDFSESDYSQGI